MFYRIEDRMAKDLKLSWNELLIYGVIYSSQNQTYVWGQTYLSEITWMSVATIKRSLKWMIENKLITKVSKWYQIVSNWHLKVSEWAIWEEQEKYQNDTSIAQNDTKKVSKWATYINTEITKNIKEEIIKEEVEVREDWKRKYLENVRTTEEEYNKIVNEYWRKKLEEYINKLNYYVANKWDKYKSHYLTILTRMRKANEKKIEKPKPDLPDDDDLWIVIRR